jgi:hypothetical protein
MALYYQCKFKLLYQDGLNDMVKNLSVMKPSTATFGKTKDKEACYSKSCAIKAKNITNEAKRPLGEVVFLIA